MSRSAEPETVAGREPTLCIPVRVVGFLAVGLPAISVFACVVISYFSDSEFISNYTLCEEVDSFISPVSYSIATFSPQRQLWMLTVVLHLPARFLLMAMLPQAWNRIIWRNSFHFASSLSILSLICLSLFHVNTMAEYYVHATSFMTWWIATIAVMVIVIHVQRMTRDFRKDETIRRLFLAKIGLMSAFIIVSFSISLAYLISQLRCSLSAFVFFCFGEYLLISLNAAFETLLVMEFSRDFDGFQNMRSRRSALLLCLVACQLELTHQKSSWWLSDRDFFYDDPYDGPSIYDSISKSSSRVIFATLNKARMHSYSRDLNYAAEIREKPETYRNPDQVLFSVLIQDRLKNVNYTVGLSANDSISAFKWSHGSAYSFVLDNDIYYVDSPEQSPIKITHRDEDGLIHGRYDFQSSGENMDDDLMKWEGSMWFSPSGKYLAYQSDFTNATKKALLTTYDCGEKYDYNYLMDYAKTGEKELPLTSISIWSVERNMSYAYLMDVQLRDPTAFHYLFGVSWITLHGKELLLTTWANRWQNETSITLCEYETATCSLLYVHNYNYSQWASPVDYDNIVHSDSSIFFLLPEPTNDNAFQHIAKIEISADFRVESIAFLPSGEYDVRHILAYRPAEDVVIYDAQAPHPWERHVYATPAGERSVIKEDRCLTRVSSNCTTQQKGSVSQGADLKIAFACAGLNPPHQALVKFNTTLDPQQMQAIVRIYHGDHELTSVPVTLKVYGGPDFNQVVDTFDIAPLPIGYKHAIVHIDVRGSGGRGWKYRSPIYGRLVTIEVEDTLDAMRMVLDKYPRFDQTRVGVFGWSYGGTMSAALVEKAPQSLFKCAISVAPVTNFNHYFAGYSERYMGDAPASSYTDLTVNVTAFKHTKLLLVHGLRDDVVLFDHSALLIEALQQADIPFELMVYPNQDHHIYRNVAEHLHHLFESFLSTCYE